MLAGGTWSTTVCRNGEGLHRVEEPLELQTDSKANNLP
jgi:hypothetical protein